MISNKNNKNIDVLKSTVHDLNNIFTSILNSVELLKIKSKDDKESLLIQNIENNSLRASKIINELLLTDADKKQSSVRLSIKNLIYDLELTLKKSFGSAVTFEINIDDNIGDVSGNYSDLFRVLLNLCVNAKEAATGNEIILISAFNLDAVKRDVSLKLKNKNYILIEIADNGKGIPENDIENIFKNGFSTKKGKKISGMGLSIVKKIVEEHAGFIEVESELGKGTTFKIYIPVFEKFDKITKASLHKSILIAEDSKAIAEELSELLKFENYIPTIAFNGEAVIALLAEGKVFDLFIVDKKMPGINGIELIKKIREIDTLVPIILASGSISLNEDNELNKLKINKYLKKPYLFDTLLKNIQELI